MNVQINKDIFFIGIDPGVTGAIAAISNTGKANVYKMPDTPIEILHILMNYSFLDCDIVCEKVHSSPQMGVSTSFTFGVNFGILKGLLARNNVDYVSPQNWQTALNCLTGGDKKISYAKAKELFPDVKGITLNTADALLIAYYGYKKYGKK